MAFLGTGLLSGRKSLGARLGQDLGSALQGLAHHKIQQRQSRELEQVGFPKELASIFHSLSPKVQEDIWKQVNLGSIGQQQEQQPQMQQAPMQDQPTYTPEQTEFLKSLPNPLDRQKVAQQFQQQNQQAMQQQSPNQQFGQAAAQQQVAEKIGQNQQPQSIFRQPGVSNTAQEANDIKRQKYEFDKQQKVEQKFQPLLKQFEQQYEASSQILPIIEEFKKLNEEIEQSGEGWGPAVESAVGGVHKLSGGLIDLRSAAGEKMERLRKLTAQLVNIGTQGVKGHATNLKVQNLEKAVPSLLQSYEGRKRIAEDMEKLAVSAQIPLAETAKVREENGGVLPGNFSEVVLPRIDAQRKEVLNTISEDPFKGVQKGLNKLPNAKDANPNKGYYDPSTQKTYVAKNGKWVVHKE